MPRETYERSLRDLHDEILTMGSMVDKAIIRSMDALRTRDVMTARQVIEDDDMLDDKRTEVERHALLLIATQQPLASDLRTIAAVLAIASELERMGDYAEGIAKISIDIANEPSMRPLVAIPRISDKARDMLDRSLSAFLAHDVKTAQKVWAEDDEIDELYDEVYHELLAYMLSNSATIPAATRLIWVSHNLERIADRVTNICERIIFMVEGQIVERDIVAKVGPTAGSSGGGYRPS